MSVYTVHEPPQRDSGASADPDRVVFVRDGFHFWAMTFGPLWLLWRRLWLALVFYVVAWIAVAVLLVFLRAGPVAHVAASAALSFLLGMEASSLWRWTLARRGWKNTGVVVGDDLESAERRFFQTWRERSITPPPPPKAVMAANYGSKPADGASEVIGLFPEPGGPR